MSDTSRHDHTQSVNENPWTDDDWRYSEAETRDTSGHWFNRPSTSTSTSGAIKPVKPLPNRAAATSPTQTWTQPSYRELTNQPTKPTGQPQDQKQNQNQNQNQNSGQMQNQAVTQKITPGGGGGGGSLIQPRRPRYGVGMGNGVRAPGGQLGGIGGQGQGQGQGNGAGMPGGPNGVNGAAPGEQKTEPEEPKPIPQLFDYRYDDTDTLMNELQEFYPYVEMPAVAKNPDKFKGSFDGPWTEAPAGKRRKYVETQLEYMESPVQSTRRAAQARVLYLLQGCFAETTSPEMQLHWVIENAKTVRAADGVPTLVLGLKDAARRYNAALDSSEKPYSRSSAAASGAVPGEPYDDRAEELMDLLGMLYFTVEVFRTDETFGDELMAMSPPLPLVLFQMVAGLKDRLPKGYPVKKVLLLLWKTLLACLGGMKEVNKAKALSRELAGLPPDNKAFTKATPMDITTFHRDTSVKYPTFCPAPSEDPVLDPERIAEGMKPIPARPNYHSTDLPTVPKPPASTAAPAPPQPAAPLPQPATPAPTPPGSPAPQQKQKKQQYQTDPNKPFIFPYSRASYGAPTSLVPYAIEEAERLYHKHEYISLGLYQLWQEREECMREERGLGVSGLIGFSKLSMDHDEDEASIEAMKREWQYDEEETACRERGDKEGAKAAREKKTAARRLYRVELIYKNTLPILQSCVIVLLKLLLATVTNPGTANLHAPLPQPPASPANEQPPSEPPVPPTREEIDVARHREITSKAVSAILLLVLKWFKASHILKFHFVAQLLFDSNCLLLVLKMFGLNDVHQVVQTKNEDEDCNFFRYCYLNCSPDRPAEASEPVIRRPRSPKPSKGENGEDVLIISEYSWRNFFSTINFLKVLQKMTKHRSHRTYMLNQYKSSGILKRMLKVYHPMMQLQVLKLIKSQMPWCGRKWRQSNMKVITSIYINCRPELRDEWLAGTDQETEFEDATPQEYALRSLIVFYNKRNYATHIVSLPSPEPHHQRTDSSAAIILEDPALLARPRSGSMSDGDVFPPRQSTRSSDLDLPYNPDGLYELEHEDDILFGEDHEPLDYTRYGVVTPSSPTAAERDDPAWNRITEIIRQARGGIDEDEISDSESVVTVGELGEDARMGMGMGMEDGDGEGDEREPQGPDEYALARQQRRQSGNENTWEHMSPKTLELLARSPAERRRSSSGASSSPLRPIRLGAGGGASAMPVFDDDEVEMPGPMPIARETDDEIERSFGAVDEVEYAYGE